VGSAGVTSFSQSVGHSCRVGLRVGRRARLGG
jgi:hypothetical protein